MMYEANRDNEDYPRYLEDQEEQRLREQFEEMENDQ